MESITDILIHNLMYGGNGFNEAKKLLELYELALKEKYNIKEEPKKDDK